MNKIIITRFEAKEKGLKRYYTGDPCKHGHYSERITKTTICIECSKIYTERYKKKNPEATRQSRLKWYRKYVKKNREKYNAEHREKLSKWREKNRDHYNDYMKEYFKNNPDKVKANRRKSYLKRKLNKMKIQYREEYAITFTDERLFTTGDGSHEMSRIKEWVKKFAKSAYWVDHNTLIFESQIEKETFMAKWLN